MPPYDDPNRPEFTGRHKPKNFARIYASCKGERLSDGKPNRECAKCYGQQKEKMPRLRVYSIQGVVRCHHGNKNRMGRHNHQFLEA